MSALSQLQIRKKKPQPNQLQRFAGILVYSVAMWNSRLWERSGQSWIVCCTQSVMSLVRWRAYVSSSGNGWGEDVGSGWTGEPLKVQWLLLCFLLQKKRQSLVRCITDGEPAQIYPLLSSFISKCVNSFGNGLSCHFTHNASFPLKKKSKGRPLFFLNHKTVTVQSWQKK